MEDDELYNEILNDDSIFEIDNSFDTFTTTDESVYFFKKSMFKKRKNIIDEFIFYSEQYYRAHLLIRNFICKYYDRYSVIDQISFPMIYYIRHAVELILKANIFILYETNEAFEIMMRDRHSLEKLFNHFERNSFLDYDKMGEIMRDIDTFDSKSDLFRYPFSEDFYKKYQNKYLDVIKMSDLLLYFYGCIYEKISCKKIISIDDIDHYKKTFDTEKHFLIITNKKIGNCFLWRARDVDSYKQVNGYTNASKILWYYIKNKKEKVELPLLFSIRHTVELLSKRVVCNIGWRYRTWINQQSNEELKSGFIPGHDLKKVLKQTIIVIKALEKEDESIRIDKERFVRNISSLREIDKEGDYFRYPISSGGIMYNYDIDLEKYTAIYYATIKFLDSLSSFATVIGDYIDEISKEYDYYYY